MGKKATIATVAVSILTVVAWITAVCIPKWSLKRYHIALVVTTTFEAGLWNLNVHNSKGCDNKAELAELKQRIEVRKDLDWKSYEGVTGHIKHYFCGMEGDNDIGALRDSFCATRDTVMGFFGGTGCQAMTNLWWSMWIMMFVVVFSTVLQLIGDFFVFAYHSGGIKKGRHKKSYWRNAFLCYTISPVLSLIGLAVYFYLSSTLGTLFADNMFTKFIANSSAESGIHLSFGIALAATIFQIFPFCLMLGNKPHEKEEDMDSDDEDDDESMPFFFMPGQGAPAPAGPPMMMPPGGYMPPGAMAPGMMSVQGGVRA